MSKFAVMPLTDYQNACDRIRVLTGSSDLIKSGELEKEINATYSVGASLGEQLGFENGKEIGYQEGYGAGRTAGFEDGYAEGKKEGGGGIDYDMFWDSFQVNGNRKGYQLAFANVWNDDIYNPKYPINCIDNVYAATSIFASSKITDTKVPITISGIRADAVFQDCTSLKRIPSLTLENLERFSNTFRNCRELEEMNVYGEINVSGMDVSASTKLTVDSLLSIINALKDFYPTIVEDYVFRNAEYFSHLANTQLVIGATYKLTYDYATGTNSEYVQEYETIFNNAEAVASKIDVYGVGESVGVHYVTDYLFYPDQYTFNVVIFDNGTGELFAIRYLQDKVTGEKQYTGNELDRIILTAELDNSTHTVTLGIANLNKLTDSEKASATKKGWVLQ